MHPSEARTSLRERRLAPALCRSPFFPPPLRHHSTRSQRYHSTVGSEIIAERAYYLNGEPDSPVIRFQLLRPDQPENTYPSCRYRLIVGGKTEESEVGGADAIDCIALCLAVVGSKIAGLNESVYNHKLRWEGSSAAGDIGLPTIENSPLTKDAYQEAHRWSSE